jgi:uncharacterized membrane protein
MSPLYEILILAIIFTLTDAIYLTSVASYFDGVIRRVQGAPLQLDIIATILCYIFLVGGLYWFIIRERRSWIEAGLLGLVIYGVYETTTKATLRAWDWTTVVMDTTWGAVLFMLSAAFTYKLIGVPIK